MQDNNINDFDLELRSALQDAQIKPGRRVWRGVSASLDAFSRASAVPQREGNFRWAPALALAFACLAAALVLFGTFDRGNQVRLIEHKAYTLADIASGEQSLLLSQADEFPSARRLPSVQRPAPDRTEVEVFDIDSSVDEAPECTQEQACETASAQSSKASYSERSAIPDRDNPFIPDEYSSELIRRRAHPTIYAKGSLSGNDSDFIRHSALNNLAPGSESAGISELSASSYGVPFSVGVGVRFPLTRRLSIGTGLDYTLLTRSFTGKYTAPGFGLHDSGSQAGDVTHSLHYLGVPVDLFFDFLTSERLKLYVRAGGEAEYCLLNRYTLHSSPDIVTSYPVKKLQYSIGAGFGVEFALGEHLGLYIDPGFRYYFYCNQPKSVRTERPVLVNFDAGLRFSF